MATSSRQTSLFGVNDWRQIYNTFSSADFQSYDYETLRRSFINYLQIQHPETFNDYIESSEFVALLDVMAFMGQAMAFRSDLNTRENFIDTAERRDSVIKLANLVNYTPKRNIAAQGWLKVQSVRTSENINDINGINLANATILWNDPANIYWQEQMNTVLNATLLNSQQIGRPGNTQTILGVRTDEYAINLPTNTLPVFAFQSIINSISMRFELVSVTSINSTDVYEIPPRPTSRFNLVYRSDNLGFASADTGFFFYFKQGTLTPQPFSFNQSIKNQVQELPVSGVNNTDTWLWQLDNGAPAIQWQLTDNLYASSAVQNNNKRLFKVASRTNDQVSYLFGDGVFADIPTGNFLAYVRGGNALEYTIDPSDISNITIDIPYVSRNRRTETLSVVLSLGQPVNSAQSRESLVAIKQNAPSQFYAQNRMVNGEDYTIFPYTLYSSIIKSTAINRTAVGVSKNLDLVDPTGGYSSTDSFAADGALYQSNADSSVVFTAEDANQALRFITNTLSDNLASVATQQYYAAYWPRYSGYYAAASADNTVYWQQSTVDAGAATGYFYIQGTTPNSSALVKTPVAVGEFSSLSLKYVTAGAQLRMVPPNGSYYFDKYNRIKQGVPQLSRGDKTEFWATVVRVEGDGYNAGQGNNPNGTGPITLNVFVPTGARIDPLNYPNPDDPDNGFTGQGRVNYAILPAFLSELPRSLYTAIATRISLNNNFSLVYDNSQPVTQSPWSISDSAVLPENYLAQFQSQGGGRYAVMFRNLNYYFASVSQTRFLFSGNQLIYDAKTGKIIRDFVGVLATNLRPNGLEPLAQDQRLPVQAQPVSSLGIANDFEVVVSAPDADADNIIDNPDFFTEITGYDTTYGADNTEITVFFRTLTDSNNIQTSELLPIGAVNTEYVTRSDIQANINQWNIGTVYYASLPVTQATITNISQTWPAIMTTSAGSNFYTAQSITISQVTGMTQVNNQQYYVKTSGIVTAGTATVSLTTTTIALYHDQALTQPVDARAFTAYQSGGTASSTVYQIINVVSTAQSVQVSMSTAHDYSAGTAVVIQAVEGTVEINDRPFFVRPISDTTVALYHDAALVLPVSGSDFTAYITGGTIAARDQRGAFYQSRLVPGTTTRQLELAVVSADYQVMSGRGDIQYQYRHNSANTFRIDPGTTNIIDLYLVTQSYYTEYQNWINDSTGTVVEPLPPSIDALEQQYSTINEYKMISDTVIFNSAVFKPLFGTKAAVPLRASLKVVRNPNTTASDSDIKTRIISAMNTYFDINNWGFGDTFFFSELSAYLHQTLGDYISTVVLVPADPTAPFGTLYEVRSAPYEIFVNGATAQDVVVIAALTPQELHISR